MLQVHATIPESVHFEDLHLSRNADDGHVVFDLEPIEAICQASGLDFEDFVNGPEGMVGAFIAAWYQIHLQQGGAPDPVQEDLLEEVRLEEERGGGFSYPPGHA